MNAGAGGAATTGGGQGAPAWRRFGELSIRNKLLAMVLLPLVVVLPLLGVLLIAWGSFAYDRLLVTKIRADLAVADGYFERVRAEVAASAESMAGSQALATVLQGADTAALVRLLREFKERESLDFVNLRTPDGRIVATDTAVPESAAPAPLAPGAGDETSRLASVEVLEPDLLDRLAPELQPRVGMPIVATRNAAPTDRSREDRAMLLVADAPVRDAAGALRGHVQAGVLLNRNLPVIDHINAIVYPEDSLPFGSRGTATLFLDDVRISTNVRLFADDPTGRAVGTRVSKEVRDAVLGEGGTWLGRAFVVSDWYVSGYRPVTDRAGQRVGMLYVGFLERPFTLVKFALLASIGIVFCAVMAAAAWVSLRGARAVFAPVERMEQTMRRVEAGSLDARVGPIDSGDELGLLARHLDRLLDAIAGQTRALRELNAELDAKVAARTRELETAQQLMLRSEKLAAVGQLTASIAHEINNPIAVIQGNLDLSRELLGADAERVRTELKLVDDQIERVRLIVTQLLQYARPGEFAGYVQPVDTEGVVDDCLVLVGHLLARTRIEVRRKHHAKRWPPLNRNELQQVLVNLLVNAIHAMERGGTLTITTRDVDADGPAGVEIEVRDTGLGLGPELIGELFKPFVTRKKDGTGLGLWISRSIVERYGGELHAADRRDGVRGAVFTLRLAA